MKNRSLYLQVISELRNDAREFYDKAMLDSRNKKLMMKWWERYHLLTKISNELEIFLQDN